jgi:hypothetical protein
MSDEACGVDITTLAHAAIVAAKYNFPEIEYPAQREAIAKKTRVLA